MKVLTNSLIAVFLLLATASLVVRYKEEGDLKVAKNSDNVKGITVTTRGIINLSEIKFKVHPEKRIPKTNNWGTIANFKVRNQQTGKIYLEQSPTTNNQGQGVIYPTPTEVIPPGNHTVLIKGISHLTKRYDNVGFEHQSEYFDFTPYGDLLAGDTHPSNDNFINALDISTLIGKLSTDDYKNDLNQDKQVNSLDLSNQIFNLSKSGDF
jgi:hypothetical protein